MGAGETIREEQPIGTLEEIDEDVDEVRIRLRSVAGDVDRAVLVK